MDLSGFIEHVAGCLEELPAEALSGETDYKGLKAWDSLAVLAVTDTIDMEYGVLLRKEQLMACKTLSELHSLVISLK